MDELVYWLAIQKVYWWFPPQKIEKAISELGSIEKLWNADEDYLINLGIRRDFVRKFLDYRKSVSLEGFAKQLNEIRRKNINIIRYIDFEYPHVLKNVNWPRKYMAPRILFHKGIPLPSINMEKCVSVVGRRSCSDRASRVAYEVGKLLAKHNYVTVSGLAVGVDSRAHKGALANGGLTIAVLPWLAPIFPPENLKLAEEIMKHGCLLSECYMKPKSDNIKWRFIERNKIISGISRCLVVVESGIKGGTLTTAIMALEMKKKVFILTPKVTDNNVAKGYNHLTKKGAEPFKSVDELIRKIDETYQTPKLKSQNLNLTSDLTKFINEKHVNEKGNSKQP